MQYIRLATRAKSQLVLLSALAFWVTCLNNQAFAQLETDGPSDAFTLKPFITGAQGVTDIAFLADGRAVVVLRTGAIWVWKGVDDIKKDAGKIDVATNHGEQGLLGVVALRSFREVPDGSEAQRTVFFYASMPNSGGAPHKVFRGVLQANDTVVVDLQNPITQGLAGTANHNGGGLIVAGGHLYISVGDTGANSPVPQNKYSTCLNVPHGKILRLNLDGTIPNDNPLSNEAMVTACTSPTGNFSMAAPDKRIYAWGLRNPYRFWIDPATSLLWIGDVGEVSKEEVSVGGKGTHFGYPFEEGTKKYDQPWNNNSCQGIKPASACTPPQYDWNRVGNGGTDCSIGGLIPDGDNGQLAANGRKLCGWPANFKTRYFFGDHGSGDVWTAEVKPDRSGLVANSVKKFARVPRLSGFRIGFDDSLYVVASQSNVVQKLSPKNYDAAACAQAVVMPMGGTGGDAGAMGGAAGSANGGAGGEQAGASGSAGAAGGATDDNGGAGGAGGDSSNGGDNDDDGGAANSSGCSCSLGTQNTGSAFAVLLLVGMLGWFTRRARKRKR